MRISKSCTEKLCLKQTTSAKASRCQSPRPRKRKPGARYFRGPWVALSKVSSKLMLLKPKRWTCLCRQDTKLDTTYTRTPKQPVNPGTSARSSSTLSQTRSRSNSRATYRSFCCTGISASNTTPRSRPSTHRSTRRIKRGSIRNRWSYSRLSWWRSKPQPLHSPFGLWSGTATGKNSGHFSKMISKKCKFSWARCKPLLTERWRSGCQVMSAGAAAFV